MNDIQVGMRVQFNAPRLTDGNPVKGLLTALGGEWGTVILDHQVEGISRYWEAGEAYTFRLTLINGLKQIK